jgi:hypothetical protein
MNKMLHKIEDFLHSIPVKYMVFYTEFPFIAIIFSMGFVICIVWLLMALFITSCCGLIK